MNEAFKATKKPVVTIEAMQFNSENKNQVVLWIEGRNKSPSFDSDGNETLLIETLEGVMAASLGDYIIKGVSGEFYPCKPEIFEKTYDF